MTNWSRYNMIVEADYAHVLLFNTRTGALVRLDDDRYRQTRNLATMPEDLHGFLLEQGFVVAEEVSEIELIERTFESAKENRDLFSATIELTTACNFRCLYCYQGHVPHHMGKQVERSVTRYLTERMRHLRHLHINWFGGEPLVRFEALKRMSRRFKTEAEAHQCQLSQHISTNGYLMTQPVADELAAIGVGNAQITLDGERDYHNRLRMLGSSEPTYDRVLSACRHVVNADMELLVRMNVNAWNAQHIDGLLSDLISNGITPANAVIHATRAVNHGNCSDEMSAAFLSVEEFALAWARMLKRISDYGFNLPSLSPIAYNCPFDLQRTVMIGADGTIRHCSSTDKRIAELTEAGEEANHTDLYQAIKERRPSDDPKCRECLYLPMCMGGCSYLQGIGEEKCIPEKYVLPQLIALSAKQVANDRCKGGDTDARSKSAKAS